MSKFAHNWKSGLAAVAGMTMVVAAGQAAAAQDAKPRAGALQAVVDCRKITGATERLACFDAAAAKLDAAEQSGAVVVVDRAQVDEAQRAAFGFNFRMPSFLTSGGGKDGDAKAEAIDTLESTVDSARQGSDGKWTIRLPDGAIWIQTDNEVIRAPRAGSKVSIRKGAMSGYFLSVDGQKSMRAKRQN